MKFQKGSGKIIHATQQFSDLAHPVIASALQGMLVQGLFMTSLVIKLSHGKSHVREIVFNNNTTEWLSQGSNPQLL